MFRWLTLSVLLSALTISGYHRARARRGGTTVPRRREGSLFLLLRGVMGLALFGAVLAHALKPGRMGWARVHLPSPLHWIGFLLAVLAIPAVHWVLRTLGPNVTETVLTKEDHELVTTGPYRWSRHPLYATGLTLFLGLGLMTSSWLVLSITAIGYVLLRLLVIPREEQALQAKFGERYRTYMLTSGRLLPKLDGPALLTVAVWIAGALTLGWLTTAGAVAFGGKGHPPLWYYLGAGVVLASFLLAPIGTGAALAGLLRARRQGIGASRRPLALFGLNLLFLLVAAGIAVWIWLATFHS